MIKSTSNFLTLSEIVEKSGTGAARVALADAGEAVDDANFSESGKHHHFKVGGQRNSSLNFWDTLFDSKMNRLVKETKAAYDAHLFRAALRSSFYNFTCAHDSYRDAVGAIGPAGGGKLRASNVTARDGGARPAGQQADKIQQQIERQHQFGSLHRF
ncbi:hypothetical protein F5Y12DRAFT_713281 [Xylaria sp. FL1777]|nr:hypothetical protein F5Y12DRAFT_713281 [Xylaria sp. FL1777]